MKKIFIQIGIFNVNFQEGFRAFSKAGKSNFFEGHNLTKQTVFYPTFPRLWIIVSQPFYNNLLALDGRNFRLLSIIKEEP